MYPPRGRALPRTPSYEAGLRPSRTPPLQEESRSFLAGWEISPGLGVTHPLPPPVRGISGGGWLVGTGGGPYFSKNKVFFKGAGLGCRLGRSWTVPPGTRTPFPPSYTYIYCSLFYFVLVGSGTCLSLWGPLRASGTLPSGRPSRQARRCHAGGVTEGVFVGRIEGSRKNRLGVLQTPKRFLTE